MCRKACTRRKGKTWNAMLLYACLRTKNNIKRGQYYCQEKHNFRIYCKLLSFWHHFKDILKLSLISTSLLPILTTWMKMNKWASHSLLLSANNGWWYIDDDDDDDDLLKRIKGDGILRRKRQRMEKIAKEEKWFESLCLKKRKIYRKVC